MVLTENIRAMAKQATIVISVHTAVFILYSYAHDKIDMLYSTTTTIPTLLILCLSPILAVLYLSTPSARLGTIALLGILPAELVYNIVSRFTGVVPLTIVEPKLIWKILYEFSFGLLLFIEVIGIWLTLKILREIHKEMNSSSQATDRPAP